MVDKLVFYKDTFNTKGRIMNLRWCEQNVESLETQYMLIKHLDVAVKRLNWV